jgi:hypothetical protein
LASKSPQSFYLSGCAGENEAKRNGARYRVRIRSSADVLEWLQDKTGQIFRQNGSLSHFLIFNPTAHRACIYAVSRAISPLAKVG